MASKITHSASTVWLLGGSKENIKASGLLPKTGVLCSSPLPLS